MKNENEVRCSGNSGDAVRSGTEVGSDDGRFKFHGVYRHFKGGLYILEDIIYNSETDEKMVAYRALYGDGRLWCRPYEMFFEEVDHEKYPDARQKYRFELLEMGVEA